MKSSSPNFSHKKPLLALLDQIELNQALDHKFGSNRREAQNYSTKDEGNDVVKRGRHYHL